jgi:hypothetical protein
MPTPPPTIYLIAGCNGAGKTAFAREFLLKEVGCINFLMGRIRHLHTNGTKAYAVAMRVVRKTQSQDDLIVPVRRAMNRAARKARAENRRLGLPLITWKNGKTARSA